MKRIRGCSPSFLLIAVVACGGGSGDRFASVSKAVDALCACETRDCVRKQQFAVDDAIAAIGEPKREDVAKLQPLNERLGQCKKRIAESTIGTEVLNGEDAARSADELPALRAYKEVSGKLEISGFEVESQATNLPLERVGDLRITGMTADDLRFDKLSSAKELVVYDGDIGRISGFGALTVIEGDATIGRVRKTSNISGLAKLATVGGKLELRGMPQLETVDGFGSLGEVGGDLVIAENRELTGLGWLGSLVKLGGNLTIVDNPKLPTCSAKALKERLQATGWSGTVEISGNDDEAACD